ncbi:MAG TPA: hypothetical protein ENK26_05055 [Gammaproteobacteria bacterium]|nr:hypothetical protein [Gammaproteobacteria bacterium]
MKIVVDLPEAQILQLTTLANEKALSRAELIRRAIVEYLRRQNEDEAFGLWKQRNVDSLHHENTLRDEWAPQ